MTYLELALCALQQLAHPAGASEIWGFIEQNRLYAELDSYNSEQGLPSIGKTPWDTFGAVLYVEAKKPDGKITAQGSRPKLFSLRQAFSGSLKALPLPENAAVQTQKARFHERDLHPLLCKFLAEHPLFAAQSRTIFHEKSGKSQKGADKWLYPDMVGVQFEYADYEHSDLLKLMERFDRLPIKIFSFEIKIRLDFSNYKESFFQAVSNSSWANEGYLAALSVQQDGEFREALQKLSQSFGIGIILLDAANVSQSEILSPARHKKQTDYSVMHELAIKNPDFAHFLKTIAEYDHQNRHRFLAEFDKVKNDAEMTAYLAGKGIISDGKAETV
jgi:putative uncharacterized protein (fragment)